VAVADVLGTVALLAQVIAERLVERRCLTAETVRTVPLLKLGYPNRSVTLGGLLAAIPHRVSGLIQARTAVGSSTRSRQRLAVELLWLLLLAFSAVESYAAETVGKVPRVLILYPFDERLPAQVTTGDAVRKRLLDATAGKIELYSEFLDLARFPEKAHVDRMARYLAEKYVDHRPDVVVALAPEAIKFIAANRAAIAPEAKIVFTAASAADAAQMNLPRDVVGALTEFDIAKTLELARGLQPGVRHLVIIAGSADYDQNGMAAARRVLAGLPAGFETTYLTGLTIDAFVERARQLSPDTIVLFLSILKDDAGRNVVPREALEKIARAAGAPVYGVYSSGLGFGIVGGNAATFEAMGTAVADLAVDALAGKPIDNVIVPRTYFADARQLRRWGLSESSLPPGTLLSFKESTLWEEHWATILAAVMIIAVQGTIITGLLVERRRRRAAERESRLHLLEVAHLSQSATAGALSASIGHELNQPLSAIRTNAEAGELILQGAAPDLGLVRQILADIREDDVRATEIISQLRGLLKKRSNVPPQEFDLNDVVRSAGKILHAEAQRRGVDLVFRQAARELPVRADRVHLQQVILNLANNAMDAMLDPNLARRRLLLETAVTKGSKAEVVVADTGPGIPSDQLEKIFEPFRTSKAAGTGLGLPIARAILNIHDGKIWADNATDGGAVFRFVLPLARAG
jgi:signal transduction histidine kinase